jgi:hypothetical protein
MSAPERVELEPVQIDPSLWPPPRPYPGDDSPDVGHGVKGETAVGEPEGFAGAEAQWIVIPCPDYSSRGAKRIVAGIFHTAEGASTVTELGNFFKNTPRFVSSHVGTDTAGRRGRYVPDQWAAWTNPDVNESTLTLEQCAFAAWSEKRWLSEKLLLEAGAAWAAELNLRYGIPLRWITPAQLNAAVRANDVRLGGFSDHYCVTVARARVGGHTDCGPGFRGRVKDQIMARARVLAAPSKGDRVATNEQLTRSFQNLNRAVQMLVARMDTDDVDDTQRDAKAAQRDAVLEQLRADFDASQTPEPAPAAPGITENGAAQ